MPDEKPDDNPLIAFRFELQLTVDNPDRFGLTSKLCGGQFSEIDGLEMSNEVKTVREGGNNLNQIHLVGPVTYGQLTLKRGMTPNLDLWKWFKAAAGGEQNGRGTMAQGAVEMRDASNTKRFRFELTDCLPIKMKAPSFNAKDGAVAIEEMQIAYSSFTVRPA
jgi:phage tail-like protein